MRYDAVVVGAGPERPRRRDHPGAGGPLACSSARPTTPSAAPRAPRSSRSRASSTTPSPRSTRWASAPPSSAPLPLAGARAGVGAAARADRAPLRRRQRRACSGARPGGDRRDARRGRRRLPPRCSRPSPCSGRPWRRTFLGPCTSPATRCCWPASACTPSAPRRGLCEGRFRRRPRARAARRQRRAHAALPLRLRRHRGVRAGAQRRGPRRRLALRARRRRQPSRARSPTTSARSAARSRPAPPVSSLAELPPARAVLLDLTPRQILRVGGDRLPAGYRDRLAALPLRPGRLQGRLGARRAHPWRAAALPGRRAPCTSSAATRELLESERDPWSGRARRAPLRPLAPAEPLRPRPRPARKAHRLGLLPRAERLAGRHDRAHRGPGRALRPRLPRPRPRPPRPAARRPGAPRRQPRRRRRQRRGGRSSGSSSSAPPPASTPTPPRPRAFSSAPPPPRPAAPSTACAATTPRRVRCGTSTAG